MRTRSKYTTPIHNECVTKFINPPTNYGIEPNYTLRKFILDWAKSGKKLSPSTMSREYQKLTGDVVSKQRFSRLISKLGADTVLKLRNGLLVFGIISATVLGQLTVKAIFPTVRDMVFPKVYANAESIVTLEGAVSHPSEANAGQTVIAEAAPSSSWDEFVQAVEKVAPMYNFPKNVVLAQGALESARGNSTFAQERNNYLGIGAFDSNPDQAYTFENAEQCVIEYMRIIRKNFPEAWANRDNPEQLLYHLKHNKAGKMYATDQSYIEKVQSMKEWSE